MDTIKTPTALEFLLHCYYSPMPYDHIHHVSTQEAISSLSRAGMIDSTTIFNVYTTTPKAEFYIKHILNIPFPIQETKFIIPENTNVEVVS